LKKHDLHQINISTSGIAEERSWVHGLTRESSLSALCAGCGHNSVSATVAEACWEMNIERYNRAN